MVLEGKLQEHSLGELDGLKSLIVVADNPSDDYDTAEFDMALEDRFITLDVEASVEEWLKYARKIGVVSVITDYIAEYPDKLTYKPEDTGEKGSTPRAWEKLSDILKSTPKNSGLVYSLIVSKVGKVVGSNFFHYYNNYIDILKPEDVLKTIGKSKLDTEEEQRKVAKKLAKKTQKLEVIAATELANKMVELCKNGKCRVEDVIVTVASFNYEVGAGIFKSWKNDEDYTDFAMGDFVSRDYMPNKWFIVEILNKSNSEK
jgi:hypothetical protein